MLFNSSSVLFIVLWTPFLRSYEIIASRLDQWETFTTAIWGRNVYDFSNENCLTAALTVFYFLKKGHTENF